MKRIMPIIMVLCLTFCLSACSDTPIIEQGTTNSSQSQSEKYPPKLPSHPADSEVEVVERSEFSYAWAKEQYCYEEGLPGVCTEGFVNVTKQKVETKEQAIALAKNEVTIEYNHILFAFDEQSRVWFVDFSMESVDPDYVTVGGDQAVYLDENGITLLIVYGE